MFTYILNITFLYWISLCSPIHTHFRLWHVFLASKPKRLAFSSKDRWFAKGAFDLKKNAFLNLPRRPNELIHRSLPTSFLPSCIYLKTIEWKVPRVEPLTKLMDMLQAPAIGACSASSRIQLVNHSTICFQLQLPPPISHYLPSATTSTHWGIGGFHPNHP